MNCHSFQKRLYEYLDGGLSPAKNRAAERHLGRCDACREAVRREQEIAQFLSVGLQQSAEAVALDSALERRIAAALRREPASVTGGGPFNRFWPRFAWPLAAAVFLIIAIPAGRHFFAGRTSLIEPARTVAGARPDPVLIHVSYGVSTYTFLREGNMVTDALTCDTRVENGSLLVRN